MKNKNVTAWRFQIGDVVNEQEFERASIAARYMFEEAAKTGSTEQGYLIAPNGVKVHPSAIRELE